MCNMNEGEERKTLLDFVVFINQHHVSPLDGHTITLLLFSLFSLIHVAHAAVRALPLRFCAHLCTFHRHLHLLSHLSEFIFLSLSVDVDVVVVGGVSVIGVGVSHLNLVLRKSDEAILEGDELRLETIHLKVVFFHVLHQRFHCAHHLVLPCDVEKGGKDFDIISHILFHFLAHLFEIFLFHVLFHPQLPFLVHLQHAFVHLFHGFVLAVFLGANVWESNVVAVHVMLDL